MTRKAFGGKTVYGARVGILMLDTNFPRAPGDTGNAATWPFPVLYKVVKGATAREVVHEKGGKLRQAFLDAAAELVKEGADGITTTGGFLSVFQKDLAAHVGVPVASSSLLQVPLAQSLLPPGRRVGILTVQGERLGADHLKAIDVDPTVPIVGTEKGTELTCCGQPRNCLSATLKQAPSCWSVTTWHPSRAALHAPSGFRSMMSTRW